MLVSSLLKEEASLLVAEEALVYESSRLSVGVLLPPCSYSRTVLYDFPLDPRPLQPRVLVSITSVRCGFLSRSGP